MSSKWVKRFTDGAAASRANLRAALTADYYDEDMAEAVAAVVESRATSDTTYNIVGNLLRFTKSPIERIFALGLIELAAAEGMAVVSFAEGQFLPVLGPFPAGSLTRLVVEPQREIGGLHPDFLIRLWIQPGGAIYSILVECDGHDFHEKTKEQAARDKARDRRLLDEGFTVARFTGSEIHADPHAAGAWVLDHLWKQAGVVR